MAASAATTNNSTDFAAKLTMDKGDAWLNSTQNTAKGFIKGLVGENPKAEANMFTVLSHKDTQYGKCTNGNISVYNSGNLVGFIGYRDENGDLIEIEEFIKDLPKLKVKDITTTRDSEVINLFE